MSKRKRQSLKLERTRENHHHGFLRRKSADKKEPDFLVCLNGKWGILEVMGETFHPSATAIRDHDRARLFKDYGLVVIEFYDASRCYSDPEAVVDDFLRRLQPSY